MRQDPALAKQKQDSNSNLDAITSKVGGLLDSKTTSAAPPPLTKSLFDRISSDEPKMADNEAAPPLPPDPSAAIKAPEASKIASDAPLPPDPPTDKEENVIEDAPLPPEPSMTKPKDTVRDVVPLPPVPDTATMSSAEKPDASKEEPADAKPVEAEEDSDLLQTSYEVQVKLQDLQADPNNPLYSAKSFEQLNLYVAEVITRC